MSEAVHARTPACRTPARRVGPYAAPPLQAMSSLSVNLYSTVHLHKSTSPEAQILLPRCTISRSSSSSPLPRREVLILAQTHSCASSKTNTSTTLLNVSSQNPAQSFRKASDSELLYWRLGFSNLAQIESRPGDCRPTVTHSSDRREMTASLARPLRSTPR